MLVTTVSLDGALFAIAEHEAAALKAECLSAVDGRNRYVNFHTEAGHEISVLLRPDSDVYFTTVETVSPVAQGARYLAGTIESDDESADAFDLEWFDFDYVA